MRSYGARGGGVSHSLWVRLLLLQFVFYPQSPHSIDKAMNSLIIFIVEIQRNEVKIMFQEI